MTRTAPPEAEETPKEPTPAVALHTGTSNLASLLTRNLRTSGIYIAFVAIVALFAILTDGVSLRPGNITNIILQYSYILILAIGMVLVIIAGHIDLSVGSVVALTGAVSAVLVIQRDYPWWVGILAAIAVGLAVGAWQGFWVAYVGIPAFIVTLAGMLLFRGLTQQVLGNISLSPFPAEYGRAASGFLNGLLGGDGYDVFTLLIGALAVAGYAFSGFRTRLARIKYQQPVESFPLFVARVVLVGAVVMYFAWQLAHARGLPIVLIILAVLVLAYGVISKRSVFGRQICHRRQPRGGAALRRQGEGRQLLDLRQHGFPGRDRRDRLLRALQRRAAQRGQHVRAGRDRRLFHRWRGGHRRRRHRGRRHGRWPDHGRHEQRHAAHGHRPVGAADGQGTRPAARRRVRHLQQASRRRGALTIGKLTSTDGARGYARGRERAGCDVRLAVLAP